jgi:hypothetical protein
MAHGPGLIEEVIHGLGKIVEPFMRPLNVVSRAISDRLEHWLSRKPKLYVTFHPQPMMWCLARWGEEPGMQLVFMADFTHDDPHRSLVLIGAYLKGTKSWLNFFEPIEIPPQQLITPEYTLGVFVHPLVGVAGQPWRGRIIFVDQFKRTHKTEKVEFRFAGPTEHPSKKAKTEAAAGPAPS